MGTGDEGIQIWWLKFAIFRYTFNDSMHYFYLANENVLKYNLLEYKNYIERTTSSGQ